jgi:hypothetical protein
MHIVDDFVVKKVLFWYLSYLFYLKELISHIDDCLLGLHSNFLTKNL